MCRIVAYGTEVRACERDGSMWVVGWEEDGEVSPRALFRDLKPDKHSANVELRILFVRIFCAI